MRLNVSYFLAGIALICPGAAFGQKVEVEKIRDEAPHNAFTDLIRFRDRWYCCFREGRGHASGAGKIRIIVSDDGKKWKSAALLDQEKVDLRDAHLSITPDGRLMLNGGAAFPATRNPLRDHYSFVSFSKDGTKWSKLQRVVGSWEWLWNVDWHEGKAYGVAYGWDPKSKVRRYRATLYRSKDGVDFEKVTAFGLPQTTEATLAFDGDTMYCLQRRDGNPNTAQLGVSKPPYKKWTWKSLGHYFGGPNLIRLPNGQWWAAGRKRIKGRSQTVLGRLDPKTAKLDSILVLPSGGDTSYPGLVFHDGKLWLSYYSSHEGKTSIYLAKIRLPAR